MVDLLVTVADHQLPADWVAENAGLREAIEAALPLSFEGRRWGDELYGSVDVTADPSETRTAVEPGTIAYWPAGTALCVFWGPTPASTDDTPVAASPVAPVAKLDNVEPLETVAGDATVSLARPTP